MRSEKRINNLERIAPDKEQVVAWEQLENRGHFKMWDTGKILSEKEIVKEYSGKEVLFVKYSDNWDSAKGKIND